MTRYPSIVLVLVLVLESSAFEPPLPDKIIFNRDIRPIFSATCFKCHGPDENKRKAKLRLDVKEDAYAPHKNGTPLVPGSPAKSEVFQRITAKNEDDHMPPVKSGMTLTPRQIKLIERWIKQGAEITPHWAFVTPKRPELPRVGNAKWPRNGIDAFVLARLEQEKLSPSPEADKETLIRRATLDLTGLPPAIEEIDAFLADKSPAAYERVVDRLLASPRYGERMATSWLDGARYGDTNGYQNDFIREMWPWRDWVIAAFNRNLPYDQFTIEQLAGDLLPNPTLEQRIATGFNRNHRINTEAGSIPEEWRVEYCVDRVETTSAVWLGLTMGCGRCHDHKYDPISQKEFYSFFAFFNSIAETGGGDELQGNHPPVVKVSTPEYEQKIKDLTAAVEVQQAKLDAESAALADAQAAWEKTLIAETPPEGLDNALLAHFTLDRDAKEGELKEGKPTYKNGVFGDALEFDGKRFLDLGDAANFERSDAFSCGAWIYPTNDQNLGAFIARMDEAAAFQGYNLYYDKGKIIFQLISHWDDNALMVTTQTAVLPKQWSHIFATYDGSSKAAGIKIYINGAPVATTADRDSLSGSTKTAVPLHIASRSAGMRFIGRVDDARLYRRAFSAADVKALVNRDLTTIAKTAPADRSKTQDDVLAKLFQADHAPAGYQQARAKLDELRKQLKEAKDKIPTTMVMEDLPKPREMFVLTRGQYDKPDKEKKVSPTTPACLPPMRQKQSGADVPSAQSVNGQTETSAPPNRLDLARWIVDPSNPLAARVAANRFWERFFGMGIVKTSENFGVQSEWPSHPELLDWLATEFIRLGWDMKAFQKEIVMSATYRQSSRVMPKLLDRDPENRLLARGPRLRLTAEMMRDQALAVSGLLVPKIGGPSVKTYQPAGLWEDLSTVGLTKYEQGHGDDLYRRSMYTFIKRTVQPPNMAIFDQPTREYCVVKRSRTNTPLQALGLLNDITYVEAARKLAERMMTERPSVGASERESVTRERITYAFRLATAHRPTDAQLKTLVAGFQKRLAFYRNDPDAATKLLAIGESKPDTRLAAAELAAYTTVASVILNLDKTVTKE